MPTIKTVAEKAGVSIRTVTRVHNAPQSVSAKTRRKVAAAADALGYVPDRLAQAVRLGRSGVIGLLTDVGGSTPCSSDIVRGIEEALAERGLSLLIGTMENRGESSEAILRSFRAGRTDGVICAATYHRQIEDFQPPFTPGVLVNCFTANKTLPTIIPDEEKGGHAACAHLLERGHRRISYLTLAPDIEATRLRLAGVMRALREAGVPIPDDLARPGQSAAGRFLAAEAFDAATDLLAAASRPTAVLCGNDEMALQVYNAAARLSLAVPADLSVVGFDDHKLFSEALRPALTTVSLPYVRMGRMAVEALFREPPGMAGEMRFECPLVVRQSTAAVS